MNLVWFRNDLRIHDNPALSAATEDDSVAVAAVYFICDQQNQSYSIGSNQKAFLYQSLKQLHQELTKLNIPLFILQGEKFTNIPDLMFDLCQLLEVTNLHFNIEYPIDERNRDKQVVNRLTHSTNCFRYIADSLVAPWLVVNGSGDGYKVFSAFNKSHANILSDMPVELAKSCKTRQPENRLHIAKLLRNKSEVELSEENSQRVRDNDLFALTKRWLTDCNPDKISPLDIPTSCHKKLRNQIENFCDDKIIDYSDKRDFPSIDATSQISSALALGCISANQCYLIAHQTNSENSSAWTRQLVWRDFYRSVMWHYPHVCKGDAFLEVDKAIRWSKDLVALNKFKQGRTGIPIIDSAIQQLLQTGWMHNRLRMVVASYFCKNLWLDWRVGESFFAEHLFDYDFANNNGGWQWSASVGTDAAPYFRVFNPHSQQKRFDKDAKFIRHWLPTLKQVKSNDIHSFESKYLQDYPSLQVDLKHSRKQAIESFKNAKQTLEHFAQK